MVRRWHVPLFVVAAGLLGLLALLATLQYRWLGQVSDAERNRMRATLASGGAAMAQEFDAEVTRAYLLFQADPLGDPEDLAARFSSRYERWQATSRFPRLIKEFYAFSPGPQARLQKFDPETRSFTPVDWPASMQDWREHVPDGAIALPGIADGRGNLVIRRIASPIWESAPAIVAASPALFLTGQLLDRTAPPAPVFSYSILAIDADYVSREMLPALAEQHIVRPGGPDFQIAVVSRGDHRVLYHSIASFNPAPDSPADAATDLFSVRTQDFSRVSAEIRHFATIAAAVRVRSGRAADPADPSQGRSEPPRTVVIERTTGPGLASSTLGAASAATTAPGWQLILKHQSGSLETAVAVVRRRNLLVSSSVLGVLGASMGLLMLSVRRAQRLARQQMEFVATVSHELRTPLAVIRSAAENLADGVVAGEAHVRKYGELVRGEGRRLSELVEQILELSGIESGEQRLQAGPVPAGPLLHEVVDASATAIAEAGIHVHIDVPDDLPPMLGDAAALRRVFQNLVANAVKYGASGRWVGIDARPQGRDVEVTIADRGIGIEPSEQGRIFEPFYRSPAVIAAQLHGAGLGLSLVQRIVRAHGGRVTVRSTPGAGAAFIVLLPAATGHHAMPLDRSAPGQTIPGRRGEGAEPSPHRPALS